MKSEPIGPGGYVVTVWSTVGPGEVQRAFVDRARAAAYALVCKRRDGSRCHVSVDRWTHDGLAPVAELTDRSLTALVAQKRTTRARLERLAATISVAHWRVVDAFRDACVAREIDGADPVFAALLEAHAALARAERLLLARIEGAP